MGGYQRRAHGRFPNPERSGTGLLDDLIEAFAPVLFALLVLVCIAREIPAQVVRLEAETAHNGWARATIERRPPVRAGVVTLPDGDVVPFVVGRTFGDSAMVVDVQVHLAAGQRVTLDLSRGIAAPHTFPWPDDLLGWLGGLPHFGGVPMQLVPGSLVLDGAALTSHWRCRIGRMFVADFFARWYGEPWMDGEILLTCSNPGVPDLGETCGPWFLSIGDAAVAVDAVFQPLWYGDGQARALPVVLRWKRHGGAPGRVHAVGDVRLWPDGNPLLAPGLDVVAWTTAKLGPAASALHDWRAMVCGVNRTSGDTGEQQEQAFTCGEFVQHVPAATLTYLSALKFANRPCHHRELDGSLLDYRGHTNPRLVLWDGRAHWSSVVSPDRLGKPAGTLLANGWFGPDVEHAMHSTLAAGARLTGSPALQLELSAIGRVYLFQWTVAPGLSTSQPFAARAVGWEGILATHLWRTLEDRVLAEHVAARWRARFDAFAWMLDDLDVRTNDPRLGPGKRWIPWQQAVGAYGLDLAGRVLGRPAACAIALQHAKTIVSDAYVYQGSRWTAWENVRIDGEQDAPRGLMDLFGTPLAPQMVLRAEPQNAKAQEIVGQFVREAVQEKHMRWAVPR